MVITYCVRRFFKTNYCNVFKPFCLRTFSDDLASKDRFLSENGDGMKSVKQLLENHLVSPFEENTSVAPEERSVLLFPGQGSQYVGMVNNLLDYPNVSDMFNVASEILNFDLLNYCKNGPQQELDKTVHCQPATIVTSLAGVEKIQATNPEVLVNCVAAAGFSVGEYAALVYSGALSFESAIKLVGFRSRAMQQACNVADSTLIAAIGSSKTLFKLACEEARIYCTEELLIENPVCSVSAYLYPNTVTIGGHTAAIQFLQQYGQKFNIRKILPITVSGAFHTKLMQPATVIMKEVLKGINFQTPLVDVYSNVSGKKYSSTTEIRQHLCEQIVKPVKWEQIVHSLLTTPKDMNIPFIYEVGPGKQFGPVLKKCNGKAFQHYIHIDNL